MPEDLCSAIMLVCVEGLNHQQAAAELNMTYPLDPVRIALPEMRQGSTARQT
jgi:DNA-directed RNA polymerase specialized sigma24 family protein